MSLSNSNPCTSGGCWILMLMLIHITSCMPLSTKYDASEAPEEITDWEEYYLKLYEDEASKQTTFDTDYEDDMDLKEYYDYIDQMDEEEINEIKEREREYQDKNDLNEKNTSTFENSKYTDSSDTNVSHGEIDITSTLIVSSATASVINSADGTITGSPLQSEIASFQPVPLPSKFDAYDVIKPDGAITLAELALVTGARENIEEAFKESDLNGDGVLNQEEFHNAPWYRLTESYPQSSTSHNDLHGNMPLSAAHN